MTRLRGTLRRGRLDPMRVFALVVAIAGTPVLSAAAQAQSIGATATLDIKRVSGEPEAAVLDTRSPGFAIFVDAPATPHVSFVFEIGFEREAAVTTLSEANQVRLHARYANRMRTVSALAAIHPVIAGRVRWRAWRFDVRAFRADHHARSGGHHTRNGRAAHHLVVHRSNGSSDRRYGLRHLRVTALCGRACDSCA
jgi:hypothetical protein